MHFLDQLKKGMPANTAADMQDIGFQLSKELPENAVLKLQGELGVGKTTFVQGLAKGWGIDQPITSPSFGIYHLYSGKRNLAHVDGYRLGKAEDVKAWMLEDFLDPPYCIVVEWPEKVDLEALPSQNVWSIKIWIDASNTHWVQQIT